MAKREFFWTTERLKELRKLSRTLTIDQLCNHFQKQPDNIHKAIRFEQKARELKMPSVRERINGRTMVVTRFKVEFAEGAKQIPIAWGHQDLW